MALCVSLLLLRDVDHAESSHKHKELEPQIVSAVMIQVEQEMATQFAKINSENRLAAQNPSNNNGAASLPELVITPAEEAPESVLVIDPVQHEKFRIAAESYQTAIKAKRPSANSSPNSQRDQDNPTDLAGNCGALPKTLAALEQSQLTIDQLSALDTEIDTYIGKANAYSVCLDREIASLTPENATKAHFDSAEYQANFDAIRNKITFSEAQKESVLARHNYLLEHAATH